MRQVIDKDKDSMQPRHIHLATTFADPQRRALKPLVSRLAGDYHHCLRTDYRWHSSDIDIRKEIEISDVFAAELLKALSGILEEQYRSFELTLRKDPKPHGNDDWFV
jgi:hypothetical protein